MFVYPQSDIISLQNLWAYRGIYILQSDTVFMRENKKVKEFFSPFLKYLFFLFYHFI